MLDTIKKYMGILPQHLSENKQSVEVQSFILSYKQKDIGYLLYQDGKWTFRYSDWFKSQDELGSLHEFPYVEKIYQSQELWPFFASRIPSKINRKNAINKENDESLSLADLLKNFGRETVNNPFVLESS